MPRPCLICSSGVKSAKAAELVSAGLSDQAVANALNMLDPYSPPMSYMAVSRHRRLHIMKAAQEQLAIVGKGAGPRQERQQLATAAASDAPTPAQFVEAFFGLKAQAEKLQRIEDRLERMAVAAETNGSSTGVAALSAQALRGIETGAKLAALPGFVPQRLTGDTAPGTTFEVNIMFSDGKQETISVTTPTVPRTVIDQVDHDADAGDEDQAPDPEYDPVDLLRE
jgi:hypothetical protein